MSTPNEPAIAGGERLLRIAYVIPSLNPGGAERVTAELASIFARTGHEITIFVGWRSDADSAMRDRIDPRVHVEYISSVKGSRIGTYLGGIVWTWRNRPRLYSFDVLHCHLTYGSVVATALAFFRRLGRSPRPVIVETYHAVGMRIPALQRWAHSLMATTRDVLVLMASDPFWVRFTTRHPRLLVRTILNGASLPCVGEMDQQARRRYRRQLGIPDATPFVLGSIGMLRADRQPWIFLPIIQSLVRELGDQVHWIYVGDGPERARLEGRVRDAGLARQVHFAGSVADVRYPLSVMDVFVTLTVGEVCGIAAMEAALAGVAVIGVQLVADHRPGSREWIWSSERPEEVSAMASGLLRNPRERASLGERQRQHANQHHTVGAMAQSYRDVYEQALGAHSAPATLRPRSEST
jgi:glycosyltransferase involved in cell wall biosynthesis